MVLKGREGLWKERKACKGTWDAPCAAVVLWQGLEWEQGPAEKGDGPVGAVVSLPLLLPALCAQAAVAMGSQARCVPACRGSI